MSGKYIVVFKKSASQEVIDEQAEQVSANGGKVDKKFSSSILRGFSAEITNTYLLTLQSSLSGADSQIDYIDDVTEETVAKYMSDIVVAGGRLTQTYDWFLNGFCAAIPEPHLQLLSKNTEVDYIEPEGLPKRL
ncbi:hypothetical protein BJY52DRAFT_1184578 [Lactarius psammicola]|nr:hypothetical protein BJY52DRAFT_1184578 [Lactarius psammicola]